jgi:hypothetical protein
VSSRTFLLLLLELLHEEDSFEILGFFSSCSCLMGPRNVSLMEDNRSSSA